MFFRRLSETKAIDPRLALGGLSAVFWTLTFQTTFKYVIIALRADNHGEGGIFSLYALVKRYAGKWLLYPAIIGGSFLLADGIITPPISVSSAIEGLRIYSPDIPTIPIVIAILVLLFVAQQFGTQFIGKFFGPVMFLWFTFIAVMGAMSFASDFSVFKAINPYYAYQMLVEYPHGFWILGAVFLCTTGAEALYSDMGHCGRANIRFSWIYVKICLIMSYAGQAAWLLQISGKNTRRCDTVLFNRAAGDFAAGDCDCDACRNHRFPGFDFGQFHAHRRSNPLKFLVAAEYCLSDRF